MKNILTFILLFIFIGAATAQQERHNTQFFNYKLGYNPAYAGNKESSCLTALYRSQWTGLEGAPTTAMLSYNMPLFNQRIGVGANLERETIGHYTTINFDIAYAYRIPLGHGHLSLGAQTSLRSLEANLNQSNTVEGIDPSLSGQQSELLFNFGMGAYYSSEKFYLGLSAPRLLKNNIDFAGEDAVVSKEIHHLYFMGGLIFELNENVKLQPQVLVKYISDDQVEAPLDVDFNTNFIFVNKYFVGLSYRFGGNQNNNLGESIDFYLAATLTKGLRFGISYDMTISDLKDYESGSIEASLNFCFGKSEGEEYMNPRFF